MNGIVINIDPTAFRFSHFAINWYTLIVMLAIMAAIGISIYEGQKKGIPAEKIMSLAPWVIVAGIIGARLFHVIDKWDYYAGNPLQIFMIQQGGLAIWGAVVGGGIAAAGYARLKHISLGRLADIMVPALLVAQIIGRLACIINGDAAGAATNLPWGFIYINPEARIPSNLFGIPTHPYPVYEMLWNLIGLGLTLSLRRYLKKDGTLFLSYLSFYAVGRFILTFIRQENIWFWDLQEAQVIAIAVLILSVGVMIYLSRKAKAQMMPET